MSKKTHGKCAETFAKKKNSFSYFHYDLHSRTSAFHFDFESGASYRRLNHRPVKTIHWRQFQKNYIKARLYFQLECVLISTRETSFSRLRDTNRTWNTTYSDQCHSNNFTFAHYSSFVICFCPILQLPLQCRIAVDQESHYFPVWQQLKHVSFIFRFYPRHLTFFSIFFFHSLALLAENKKIVLRHITGWK